MPRNELVTRLSETIRLALEIDNNAPKCLDDLCRSGPCHCCEVAARAVLKAHEEWRAEQGLVVVPRMPTDAMRSRWEDECRSYDTEEAWCEGVSAALQDSKKGE